MKKNLRPEDAYRMMLGGKLPCDIAKELGLSIAYVSQRIGEFKKQKDRKEHGWGTNLSIRTCKALYHVGALGSDEKILEAYKTGWLSVGGESPTPNYGRKSEMEIREYLFAKGLLPEEEPNAHRNSNREFGLADLIAQNLKDSAT